MADTALSLRQQIAAKRDAYVAKFSAPAGGLREGFTATDPGNSTAPGAGVNYQTPGYVHALTHPIGTIRNALGIPNGPPPAGTPPANVGFAGMDSSRSQMSPETPMLGFLPSENAWRRTIGLAPRGEPTNLPPMGGPARRNAGSF